jgi:hypothetical protein
VSALAGLTLAERQAVDSTDGSAVADRLAPWRRGVTVTPVSRLADRHTMHAYYTAVPEAPDGTSVLLYASGTREGYEGSIAVVERASGAERVLVAGVSVEDTHRAACQQWASEGRRVVFHDLRDGVWVVACVDLASGAERVLASDRQLGWGQPDADLVPVYGPHWDPGAHRDLDLLDLTTGEQRTVLAAEAVRAAFPEAIAQEFGDRPISIFFPALSPDLSRVFFKIATPLGGDFRSKEASHRALLVAYDLASERLLFVDRRWGHPAWHPDSRTILDVPNVLIDSDTGARRSIPDLPLLPGAHPSFDASGDLVVADVALERLGGASGERGVVVEDLTSRRHVLVDRFDDAKGAASWRRNHPHPVFSADGQRLYYCVSATPWAQLCVATPRDR